MTKREIAKAYEPKNYEDDIYKRWEDSGFFNPDVCIEQGVSKQTAKHFSIVLPPPNVTGTLHMGHAAMLAIEDVMVRYHRMKGDRTLWIPGTDHAGIATQTKVEKIILDSEGKTRQDLGREEFLKRVDAFAKESHDTIVAQSKKMGASLDWSREAYTLDAKRNLAVRIVFKKMYDDGLIYLGNRIVNWCTRCHSTLADDEVEHVEQKAKLYTFKYSSDFPIAISTTRPETKLGDTAVAVNPKDKRYKKYIGNVYEIKNFAGGPDLEIIVIGDNGVDENFGTGAVGVTPSHSQTDYEMGKRHELNSIKIINEDGRIMNKVGDKYAGITVAEAREEVVKNLKELHLLTAEPEEIENNLSICYRCSTPIEPLTSLQWFIDVNKKFLAHSMLSVGEEIGGFNINNIAEGQEVSLKELMQTVVKSNQIKIIPERFKKTYFHWVDNLRDWCISRQIWYGHRIPVYYCKQENSKSEARNPKCVEPVVSIEEVKKCSECGGAVEQDSDTLDTWFSSGLWTFSTMNWTGYIPDSKGAKYHTGADNDLGNYHPTTLLETGYDILFFWVARMILMTTYVLGDIPFETVYLHGLVRDEKGRKMSKSLGNAINPLDMIEKYGTDATRLSLLLGNTPGNDMKLSVDKIAGFRNFTNKLWNISRFMLLNIEKPKSDLKKPTGSTLSDKWILSRLDEVTYEVTTNLEEYKLSLAGEKLRDFTWGELADWYLEIAKVEGNNSKILNYILNNILKLWHPFMPFVTEAIWSEIYGTDKILMVERWPAIVKYIKIDGSVEEFLKIKDLIEKIRSLRADYKIDPAKKLTISISAPKDAKLLEQNKDIIIRLARLENLNIKKKVKKTENSVVFVLHDMKVLIDLLDVLDVSKEKDRIEKEIKKIEPYIDLLHDKLNKSNFARSAPEKIVEIEKNKLAEARMKLKNLKEQLTTLPNPAGRLTTPDTKSGSRSTHRG
ncbi:MAG: valine--tRNA ligase [bacterium]|nr:valine--tRNA ligase [bacterium]